MPHDEPPRTEARNAATPRRGFRLLMWLVGAWLVPVITHVLGVDWLLPPWILLMTAAMLRGGRSLLDRLMLAVFLLVGATAAAGLVFTFWPWGLSPVPVAGWALTGLALIHVLGGRRLSLPRPTLADVTTAGAATVAAVYFALPYLRTDDTGRLALLLGAEDNARHLSTYDTIRRVGGYLYWHTRESLPDMYDQMHYYPQGWHLTSALLDGFARSSTDLGDMSTTLNFYVFFAVAAYGLLAMALLWAVQWIAGPLLTFWRRLPVLALLVAVLMFGELPLLPIYGFVGEILGLAVMVVLIAVVARRPGTLREQIVLVGALVVAVGYAYHLLLPAAFLAAAVWAFRHRRPIVADRRMGAILAFASAVAAVPAVLGFVFGKQAQILQAQGGVHPSSRAALIGLGALLLAALLTPAGRRLRVWRSYAYSVLAVLCLPAALKAYLVIEASAGDYYFEKTLSVLSVALLAGIGALALFLPQPKRHTPVWPIPLDVAAPTVVAAAGIATILGVGTTDSPYRGTWSAQYESLTRLWHTGAPTSVNGPMASLVMDMNVTFPARPDIITVVLGDGGGYQTYIYTLYLATYQRTSGLASGVMPRLWTTDPVVIGNALTEAGHPVRIVAATADGATLANHVKERFPELDLAIETL